MKIEGGRGIGLPAGGRKPGAAAAPGFAAPADAPARASAAGTVAPAAALDMILALQAEEFDTGKRSRQLRRAERALEALTALEQGLLEGRAPGDLKARLAALQAESAPTGEPALDALLLEIDIRVAVELAKLERISA